MRNPGLRRLAALVSLLLVFGLQSATALQLGDPAPALKVAAWVKGKPIDLKAGKDRNVYVIEFWATWCPPCRAAIPHLTELQRKHRDKGLVVIGLSVDQKGLDAVKPFVEEWGDKMDYTVALDRDQETSMAYMEPFGLDSIPHAFLVDKAGRLVWHGTTGPKMDKAIEEVIAGKYDLEAAKDTDKAMRLVPDYLMTVQKADTARDNAARDAAIKKARATGEQILKLAAKNPDLLSGFAWMILTEPRLKNRDRELALRFAKGANDLTAGKDADVLDTYARALFDNGQKAEAVKTQKKAIEVCKDPAMAAELKKRLAEYEKPAK